jgi:hypothetical protein
MELACPSAKGVSSNAPMVTVMTVLTMAGMAVSRGNPNGGGKPSFAVKIRLNANAT